MIGCSSSLHLHISSPMRNQKMNVAYMFYLVFQAMTPPKKAYKWRSSQYLLSCHENSYKWQLSIFIHKLINSKLLDIVASILISRPFFRLIRKLYCNSLSPISNNKVFQSPINDPNYDYPCDPHLHVLPQYMSISSHWFPEYPYVSYSSSILPCMITY